MAITSEIIGKLGGEGAEVIPVNVTASGVMSSEEVFHTVEVPEGETWLVALHGNLDSRFSGAATSAQLVIGSTEFPQRALNGSIGLAHVGTGTMHVKMRRNTSTGSDYFTGHVYTVKL